MKRLTQVWVKGKNWRTITAYQQSNQPIDIQYSWGSYDRDVDYFIQQFHGNLAFAMESSIGSGRERWYFRLTKPEMAEKVKLLSANARKAGFENRGVY